MDCCFAAAAVTREEDDDEDVEQKGTVEDAAALAIAAQPTGFTLATTSVQTEVCVVVALTAVLGLGVHHAEGVMAARVQIEAARIKVCSARTCHGLQNHIITHQGSATAGAFPAEVYAA